MKICWFFFSSTVMPNSENNELYVASEIPRIIWNSQSKEYLAQHYFYRFKKDVPKFYKNKI